MFVPVACSRCGKPFQVPEETVGQTTACPWCQSAVLALPIGGATTPIERTPSPPTGRPEPRLLSLDDEPSWPKPRIRIRALLALLLVAIVTTAITIALLRRKEGYLTDREWRPFTPPDNSCTIDLLGKPIEDAGSSERGVRRFLSEGWYSGTVTWIGWHNLNAAEVQVAVTDEAWHDPQFMKIFDAERNWLKDGFGGTVLKDATIQFKSPLIREMRLKMPAGKGHVVERQIVHAIGSHPRIYFIGIAGKRFDPEGNEVQRLVNTFRVLE
jgi:hypothetical protein